MTDESEGADSTAAPREGAPDRHEVATLTRGGSAGPFLAYH